MGRKVRYITSGADTTGCTIYFRQRGTCSIIHMIRTCGTICIAPAWYTRRGLFLCVLDGRKVQFHMYIYVCVIRVRCALCLFSRAVSAEMGDDRSVTIFFYKVVRLELWAWSQWDHVPPRGSPRNTAVVRTRYHILVSGLIHWELVEKCILCGHPPSETDCPRVRSKRGPKLHLTTPLNTLYKLRVRTWDFEDAKYFYHCCCCFTWRLCYTRYTGVFHNRARSTAVYVYVYDVVLLFVRTRIIVLLILCLLSSSTL